MWEWVGMFGMWLGMCESGWVSVGVEGMCGSGWVCSGCGWVCVRVGGYVLELRVCVGVFGYVWDVGRYLW